MSLPFQFSRANDFHDPYYQCKNVNGTATSKTKTNSTLSMLTYRCNSDTATWNDIDLTL